MAVALAALPGEHPPITRIQFHFGIYCPPGALCAASIPNRGFVIFEMEGQDLFVRVVEERDGAVVVPRGVEPYPPN